MGENQLGQAKYNKSSISPEVSMRAILSFVFVLIMSAGVFAQQTLGDIARQNRTKKKGTSNVKLDDDNMPRTATPQADTSKDKDKKEDENSSAADKSKDDKDATKKENADAQSKKGDEIKGKLEAQKQEIARLQRELDISQREAKLRAATFYGDAGAQLRDQAKFAEDMRKQQEEMDSKKQALDAAQQKLADLQEEARKSGVKSE
jgi:hypothetical protein